MPEAFKLVYSIESITQMAMFLKHHHTHFNTQAFIECATSNIDELEMKQRSDQIVEALHRFMPQDFEQSAQIFSAALCSSTDAAGLGNKDKRNPDGIEGWLISPIADYVGRYGMDNFDTSMYLLRLLTQRHTAEFAIRYFLKAYPKRTLQTLASWIPDDCHHVRRLVSEGSRPRLPWGMRLHVFVENPAPLIPLLEALKDDESEYVRRSVANSLNDIAKDHPSLVSSIAEKWLVNASVNRHRLVKHACRTLLKQGHPQTLAIFGFQQPQLAHLSLLIDKQLVTIGESLELILSFSAVISQSLIIDYVIHHQKANGITRPKVFKWKTVELKKGQGLRVIKRHSFKPVTTRVYHAGLHYVEVLINGVPFKKIAFDVVH